MLTRIIIPMALLYTSVQGTAFTYLDIVENINKNLAYLEKTQNLSRNSSFNLAWGLGELYILQANVPGIEPSKLEDIKDLIKRYDFFVQKALKENPDDTQVQLLFHPQSWGLTGNYTFVKGRIPEGNPLDQSLQEIYEKSVSSPVDEKCNADLIQNNKGSEIPRRCDIPCQDIMSSKNVDSGISVDERVSYLAAQVILNCTNQIPQQMLEIAAGFCTHIKRQVNTMFERRYEAQFGATRYYFLNKLLLCGGWGFPEFYSDEFISEVIGSINTDGSVGTKDDSEEAKEVLTSHVAAILSSVLRMEEEELHKPN